MAKTIRIPITNVYAGGDYTGAIYVGSNKKTANVLLDTGSSTLAIEETTYSPAGDPDAQITDMLQEVSYEDKSGWIGAVIRTDITMGEGAEALTLPKVNTAISYAQSTSMFGKYEGIMGLAYSKLNDAFIMPGPTFPPKHSYNDVQNSRKTFLDPYFTQLEDSGLVSNKFAMYTLRSQVSLAMATVADDPLNNGFLILGGGEESTDLYTGPFQNVRVLHDQWYNTNLKAIIVGNNPPINVPPPRKHSSNLTNSVIDSGTNSILFDQNIFNAIVANISNSVPSSVANAINNGSMPVGDFNIADWPDITFVMEGDAGATVSLVMTPDSYWQANGWKKGYAVLAMEGDNGAMEGQSILGLPLMNNYFMVFDRSVDRGLGVVKCATIKKP